MVNAIYVAMLSHVFRGIPVDMTIVVARIANEYDIDTRKHILGLRPFVDRIARFLGIDIATTTLTMVSTSTTPVGLTTLCNMRIAIQG